jgi:hypothetical protein
MPGHDELWEVGRDWVRYGLDRLASFDHARQKCGDNRQEEEHKATSGFSIHGFNSRVPWKESADWQVQEKL